MLPETLENEVADAFGLQAIRTGFHDTKTNDGQSGKSFLITAIWIAEIIVAYECKIVVCVVHSRKWCKALVVTTANMPYLAPRAAPKVHPVVEMENWTDPVLDAASMINLFLKDTGATFTNARKNLQFWAYTPDLSVELNFLGVPHDDPSMNDLWKAVNATIYELAKRYNNSEVSNCTKERFRGFHS